MTRIFTTRRGTALTALAIGAALALSACASGAPEGGEQSDPAGAGASSEGFPVTLPSFYGDVTVEEKPEKIVVLSAQYADMLAAIDVEPVAFNASVTDMEAFHATYPWLEGAQVGELDNAMVNAEYQAVLEAIAKHDPDLILTTTFQVDEDLYEQISTIAPTFVGEQAGSNKWDELLEDVALLVGEPEAAEAAAAEVETAYADAREAMPGLEGRTYQSTGFDGTKFWWGNGSWLDGFGLVPADNQDNSQSGNGTNDISLENIDQLDADVLGIWFWQTDQAALEADPRYQKLPAVQHNAVIVPDLPLANATNSAGPLSLVWAIDWVTEQLAGSTIAQ